MSGPAVVANHLCKKVDIIVAFPGHLLADGVQLFEKSWAMIHTFTGC
jgi:hypothetical protein